MAKRKKERPNRRWYKDYTYSTLGTNYRRMYRNMVDHDVPKNVALEFAGNLKDTQERYNSGRMNRDDFGLWFQDEFYDYLYDDYDYDIDDAYPREA